jgi:beta-D-xylosidase 4
MTFKPQLSILLLVAATVAQSQKCLPQYAAQISAYDGCYTDTTDSRALTGAALSFQGTNSQQLCANACGAAGFNYSGVEFT